MFFDYNIIQSNKQLIILFICLIVVSFAIFILSSYVILKMLQVSIDYNNIFFYQYNKKCQKILDQYGDCKIKKIYLVRQPFGKVVNLAFNLITLFKYNKYIAESQENYPYHPAFILEIKTKDHKIKFLLLEKNHCINLCETFLLNKIYDFQQVRLKNNKLTTLNKILKKTQKRMGTNAFFNWNLYQNNCQEFSKEILLTIHQYTEEHKEFIFRDKIMKLYNPSEFTLHIVNCLFIIINFVEKFTYLVN
jgi:hypothetical protein